MMNNLLFTTHTVRDEFRERLRRVENAIKELEEIPDVESEAAKLFAVQKIESVSLRRQDAPKTHEPVPDGIRVLIRIPVEGDLTALSLKPTAAPASPGQQFRGAALRIRDSWSDETEDNRTEIRLTKTFAGPSVDEINAWGKDLTDRIEQHLAQVLRDIDTENAALEAVIADKVRERKATLEAGEGLGDLGIGI